MLDLSCWQFKLQSCYYSDRLIDKILQLNTISATRVDLVAIKKAIYYAKKYHGSQKRLSGEPFYSHPLEVAYIGSDYIFETDFLIVSILHDILEDTSIGRITLGNIFSPTISNKVLKLTKIKSNRKINTAEIVKTLWIQKEFKLLLIKQIDRLHNMQSIYLKEPSKIKKTVDETIEIFLVGSAYLGLKNVESQLTKLCAKFFPKLSYNDQFHQFLTHGENVQLLAAPIFQNEVNHISTQHLKVKI